MSESEQCLVRKRFRFWYGEMPSIALFQIVAHGSSILLLNSAPDVEGFYRGRNVINYCLLFAVSIYGQYAESKIH